MPEGERHSSSALLADGRQTLRPNGACVHIGRLCLEAAEQAFLRAPGRHPMNMGL